MMPCRQVHGQPLLPYLITFPGTATGYGLKGNRAVVSRGRLTGNADRCLPGVSLGFRLLDPSG